MKKFKAQFMYTLKNRELFVRFFVSLVFLVFLVFLTLPVFNENQIIEQILNFLENIWNRSVGPLVGLATLFVAIAVWVAELTEEWRNQLPKRLTVNFVYSVNDELKTVMRCEQAHLSDIADVRALGQQIGSQLVDLDAGNRHIELDKKPMLLRLLPKKPPQKGPTQLNFCAPYITQDKGDIEYCPEIGFFRHFTVYFTLTKLPVGLDRTKCKLWVKPFGEENISYEDCSHYVCPNHH